jgi:hypothetical protein
MAVKIYTLPSVTTAVDNTAQSLSVATIITATLAIQAEITNTESVFIGGPAVSVTDGIELEPGDVMEIEGPSTRGIAEEFDVSEVYILTTTAGQKVRLTAFARKP